MAISIESLLFTKSRGLPGMVPAIRGDEGNGQEWVEVEKEEQMDKEVEELEVQEGEEY